jgi:hypothetical protein
MLKAIDRTIALLGRDRPLAEVAAYTAKLPVEQLIWIKI